MRYGFVIDQSTCIGCHACTVACKTEHEVPLGVNRTWVKYVEKGTWPDSTRSFSVMRCNHCSDAPCVTICPTGALFKRSDGIVDFDTSQCIGCKSCMQACPYDALYIDPNDHTAQKCNYCVHRVEVGIEPACVVVCPEQSIVAGDLDNPESRIAKMVASGNLSQRATERGTSPNVWYKGVEPANLKPLGANRTSDGGIWTDPTEIERSWLDVDLTDRNNVGSGPPGPGLDTADGHPRVVYENKFPPPWGWRVSSYFLTKAISAGIAIAAAMALIFGAALEATWIRIGAPLVGGLFLLVTGVLLVWDLKRPDRFYYLLTRGNSRSWLVRGSWILAAQAVAFAAWFLAALADADAVVRIGIWTAAIIGFATAGYTAFLFKQARGRVLWETPLLVWHMIAAAMTVGGGVSLMAAEFSTVAAESSASGPLASGGVAVGTAAFAWTMLIGAIAMGVIGGLEGRGTHSPETSLAYHHMTRGAFANRYWIGLGLAVAIPIVCAIAVILGAPVAVGGLGGVAALFGVWLVDDAFVRAGQSVPLT